MRTYALALLAACSPYDPTLPAQPFLCGSAEPKCPDGYTCVSSGTLMVCASTAPGAFDGGITACTKPFTGELATWDFTAAPGSQVSTGPLKMAAGVTAGLVTRSATLTASDGTNSINATNWPTSAQLDPNAYFTFTLTPQAGCALDASSIAIDVKSSATGPLSASVATSADTFAATSSVSPAQPTTAGLTATGATAALEIRVFGFAAGAATGTMRIQNMMTVTGALH